MSKVPVPFTESEIDTSEPSSALMTVALLIGGFTVFSMASAIGDYAGGRLNQILGSVMGFNPATGESEDGGVPGV